MKTRATLTIEKETDDLELEIEGDVRLDRRGDFEPVTGLTVLSAWALDHDGGHWEPEDFNEQDFSRSELGLAEEKLYGAYEKREREEAERNVA